MATEHLDVLIVGAGLSGVSAAWHLQANCPTKRYAILEGRDVMGGTWDLFRYPGIRSDSDMHTLGYSFKPWTDAKAIADGPSILAYIRDTAAEFGIDRHVRYGHRVKHASWSSRDSRWTVEAETGGEKKKTVKLTCNFLFMCSGYYDYASGYSPAFAGVERFQGRVVHPQKWTSDVDYAGKKVVVIGSGATAVTLVPEMAKTASSVTMLQRSPTYIVSMPDQDKIANTLRQYLPSKLAYGLTRWKNVGFQIFFYRLCRTRPDLVKKLIRKGVVRYLGPDFDVDTHFKPSYNPWDQRLCLVPNGDLFRVLRKGKASIVTDHIDTFTEKGIRLKSGRELEADVVVTATGLNLKLLGGMTVSVDGRDVEFGKAMSYKGMMFTGVPNLAVSIGYTNASWTLKCDLTCEYVCRLLNHMDRRGYASCVPDNSDPSVMEEPFLDFSSGYVQRSIANLPKQGSKAPWKLYQNYARDLVTLRYGNVDDGAMQFIKAGASSKLAA